MPLDNKPLSKMPSKTNLKSVYKQRGYLMPMAIAIMVVLGLLVATLARTTSQTSFSVTQEGISLQTFYAAETGAQFGMNSLFYDTGTALTRVAVDGRCAAMSDNLGLSGAGLNNCSAAVTCAVSATAAGSSFYTVTSVGQCGSSGLDARRTIQVSAVME